MAKATKGKTMVSGESCTNEGPWHSGVVSQSSRKGCRMNAQELRVRQVGCRAGAELKWERGREQTADRRGIAIASSGVRERNRR